MKKLKLPVVIVVFFAVIAVGIGVRHVYYQTRIIDPLADDARATLGVESVEVVAKSDGLMEVWVELAPGTPIEEVYPRIETMAAAKLRTALDRVVIRDEPSPRLLEIYHRMHFAVQEGISTGLYARMAEAIDELLQEEDGVEQRVYVGDRHVFVHLREGESDLYRVIPRLSVDLARALGPGGRSPW